MKTDETKQDHARENAKAWVENIQQMLAKLTREGAAQAYVKDLSRADIISSLQNGGIDVDAEQSDEDLREELALAIEKKRFEPSDFNFDEDSAREEIENSPLSVQVRSGWHSPGEDGEDEEFEILLTMGGPALRILGELNEYREPDRAWLQYQEWGIPWTQYFDVEQETLLAFCRCFYFGE